MESLLIADHLERNGRPVLVVEGLDNLSEAALAEHAQDFVAVGDVVVRNVDVRTLIVVVTVVV